MIISLSLFACTTSSQKVIEPVFDYDGGRVSVVNDYGDCFISIEGIVNSGLEKPFSDAKKAIELQVCVEKIVVIKSNGGDLEVAMRIGKSIRLGKYATDMHSYCESACVFMYIGGVRRFAHQNSRIAENSRLGVHQPASELLFKQCIGNEPKNGPITQLIRQYLALMLPPIGASKLSNEMFETSCKRISYIDAKTLISSGIATEVVDFH
jgi:hypothetical protein